MRIAIDISHPAHVHFFRNPISIWSSKGHSIQVFSRDKDITLRLLDDFSIPHKCLSRSSKGIAGMARELIVHQARLFSRTRNPKPDLFLQVGGTFVVHVAKLLRRPSIVFYDTENAKISNVITYPFASAICTPSCYQGDLGKKHVRYPGFHELGYLHPSKFSPNKDVVRSVGIDPDQPYVVLRFVGWESSHDLLENGLTSKAKIDVVRQIERYCKVMISSEAPIPTELERYQIDVPGDVIHHVLAYAMLCFGESATMASEASVLGVPSVFISPCSRGYIDELQNEYEMSRHFIDWRLALKHALQVIATPKDEYMWDRRWRRMITDKADVSEWVVNFVERFHAQQNPTGQAQ